MTEYTEDKCFVKTNEWIVFAGEIKYDEVSLLSTSCKNIGCHRGLVRNNHQVYPSGACLIGLIAVKEQHQDNEELIQPNPKYL